MSNDYQVVCDASGFVCMRSECRKQWNGLLVRKDFWEPEQPQDHLKARAEKTSVADPRPEQPDPPLLTPALTLDQLI